MFWNRKAKIDRRIPNDSSVAKQMVEAFLRYELEKENAKIMEEQQKPIEPIEPTFEI